MTPLSMQSEDTGITTDSPSTVAVTTLEAELQTIADANKQLDIAEHSLSTMVRMDAELDQEQQDQQDMADLERMIQEA